ncbi:MAG: PKD domain-containing protein [Pyrinomonadaceae bacterium]
MRLATRALIAALVTLVLCAVVSAQTLRDSNDPRNQSPAVGTGGPEGGPTGLFTIYDGSTIRKGEFTFSVAYSNYDRDPGNVDLTIIPLSFNVGLNDHVELFFKTDGYRGIKVNTPQNLSSFYLPNSQLFIGGRLCTGPAIILAPERVSGPTIPTGAVFRPAGPPCAFGGQGFTQFPFTGPGPNFGLTNPVIAPVFVSRLGTPVGGNGSFGAASNFPGIGSAFGSILPGIVLTTTLRPPPNNTQLAITVPATFTIAPTYLPDAPFINRLYGESSFTNYVAGAKIRFTGPNNPLGVAIIPFYRFWPDKANDFSGFNQMQRGAGAGASPGDFGLIGVVDARLSDHVNVSANVGYILNSNPKSSVMGNSILLDRPDELIAGVGFDFPINKHVQLIAEGRSTMYVGGRTPNAFENNPVEALGGIKIYPSRWWGIGAAYRIHLNQQGDRFFGDSNFPSGFRASEDPHGFLGQLWVGHRNARIVPGPPNQPPTVVVSASNSTVTLPCIDGNTNCPVGGTSVDLTADARDPDNDTLLYTWSVTGGRLSGEGRTVTWDLSGVQPGTYTASVEVADGCCHTVPATTTVTVARCTDCGRACPTVSVSCPDSVRQGSDITFSASISSGDNVTYNWSVSAGTITGGQGTSSITVDTAGLGGQTVTATVDVGGLDPACSRTASCSTSVQADILTAQKFDEYGNITFNDEKARLDNYAIQLQNQPGAQGYIVAYGSCAGEAQTRADRAKDYLVNMRQIDSGRLVTVDGGCRSDLSVELWIVPTGANAPAASMDNIISPCPECRRAAPRRRATRRRGRDE